MQRRGDLPGAAAGKPAVFEFFADSGLQGRVCRRGRLYDLFLGGVPEKAKLAFYQPDAEQVGGLADGGRRSAEFGSQFEGDGTRQLALPRLPTQRVLKGCVHRDSGCAGVRVGTFLPRISRHCSLLDPFALDENRRV
jgi:hypothetical protein